MNIRKSILEKRGGRSTILIALMFLGLMSPKAWGYAEKELPPSFSDDTFSSGDTSSANDTFSLSRAILTDEKGVALCQVNLVENPQFLPQFAEPGSSDLQSLDLPECEEENLDIVAQYAEKAWVKKEMAFAWIPVVSAGAFVAGCSFGSLVGVMGARDPGLSFVIGSVQGTFIGALPAIGGGWAAALGTIMTGAGIGALSGLFCYSIADRVRMFYE